MKREKDMKGWEEMNQPGQAGRSEKQGRRQQNPNEQGAAETKSDAHRYVATNKVHTESAHVKEAPNPSVDVHVGVTAPRSVTG